MKSPEIYLLKDEVNRLRTQLQKAEDDKLYFKKEMEWWRDEAMRLQAEKLQKSWQWKWRSWTWWSASEKDDDSDEVVAWGGDAVWLEACAAAEEEMRNSNHLPSQII